MPGRKKDAFDVHITRPKDGYKLDARDGGAELHVRGISRGGEVLRILDVFLQSAASKEVDVGALPLWQPMSGDTAAAPFSAIANVLSATGPGQRFTSDAIAQALGGDAKRARNNVRTFLSKLMATKPTFVVEVGKSGRLIVYEMREQRTAPQILSVFSKRAPKS